MGLRPHVHCESRTSKWAKDRKFDPSLRYRGDVKLDDVEVGSYDEEWTYVACDEDRLCPHCEWLAPHVDCIVIAVDGACEGNGMTGARAAAGVFVGKTSQYNKSVLLAEPNATNQVAELRAGILALHQVMDIWSKWSREERLQMVVIKSDSEYLVKGMTERVFKWESNGYRTCKGTPVKNWELLKQLDGLIRNLNELDVEVLFWHVLRSRNTEADELASRALRSQ